MRRHSRWPERSRQVAALTTSRADRSMRIGTHHCFIQNSNKRPIYQGNPAPFRSSLLDLRPTLLLDLFSNFEILAIAHSTFCSTVLTATRSRVIPSYQDDDSPAAHLAQLLSFPSPLLVACGPLFPCICIPHPRTLQLRADCAAWRVLVRPYLRLACASVHSTSRSSCHVFVARFSV